MGEEDEARGVRGEVGGEGGEGGVDLGGVGVGVGVGGGRVDFLGFFVDFVWGC